MSILGSEHRPRPGSLSSQAEEGPPVSHAAEIAAVPTDGELHVCRGRPEIVRPVVEGGDKPGVYVISF